ncbi:unnamed protein product [Sphagnum jensenii]|uniref:Uncharacterized protein n=1 Tax=Sphagnum jensenii TaxID=128206 RepID=A0ABP0VRE8_9BRYO
MGAICSRKAYEEERAGGSSLPDAVAAASKTQEHPHHHHNNIMMSSPLQPPAAARRRSSSPTSSSSSSSSSANRRNGITTTASCPPDAHNAHHQHVNTTNSEERGSRLSRMLSARASSVRSKTTNAAKKGASMMSEVLRGAGSVSLGKAVEALDALGSSMTNLNPGRSGGFGSAGGGGGGGSLKRSNNKKIGILAFEVANTIVKGYNLKQSLDKEAIKVLKDQILRSKSVQVLVSTDMKELMCIAAADKRDELKIFAGEVIRFGNHCRDPQWHQLDRVFDRLGIDIEDSRQSKEQADSIMQNLMMLAENTAELYHELHALDRFHTDLKRRQHEEELIITAAAAGDSIAFLKTEVKSQEKHVKTLKKRCLWSKVLEELMEQLVDIVYYMYQEIHDNFGASVFTKEAEDEYKRKTRKLGTLGLALHYANIINQIEGVFLRSNSVSPNIRDTLYQGLSPSMKACLRTRLQQSSKKDALSSAEIRGELSTILEWLVPVASNTTKAHHGFGWVGEWANTGVCIDRKGMGHVELTLLQTLHHADQDKVENYIVEVIVLLHHLVCRGQRNNDAMLPPPPPPRSPQKSPACLPSTVQPPNNLTIQGQQLTCVANFPQQQFQQLPPPRNISPPPFIISTSSTSSTTILPTTMSANGHQLSNNSNNNNNNNKRGGTTTMGGPKLLTGQQHHGLMKPQKALGLSKSQEFDTSKVVANRKLLGLSKSNSHSQSSSASKSELLSASLVYKRWNHSINPLDLDVDRIKEFDRVLSVPPSSPTHL